MTEAAFSSTAPNGLKVRAGKHVSRPADVPVSTFYELQRVSDFIGLGVTPEIINMTIKLS